MDAVELLGRVFYYFYDALDDEARKELLATYVELGQQSDADHCVWLAHNFPAMIAALSASIRTATHLNQHPLIKLLGNLCAHKDARVRAKIAAGCHEVVRHIGAARCRDTSILDAVLCLFRDQDSMVKSAVASSLGSLIDAFARQALSGSGQLDLGRISNKDDPVLSISMPLELLSAIATFLPRLIGHSRALNRALKGAERLFEHYSETQLAAVLGQCAQRLLKASLPCNVQAGVCDLFLRLLRAQRAQEQRRRWLAWLSKTIFASPCCYTRARVAVLVSLVTKYFSRAFFKEHFFKPSLALCADPVLDVRRAIMQFLPELQRVFTLPVDRELTKQFSDAVTSLYFLPESQNELVDTIKQEWKLEVKALQAQLDLYTVPVAWDPEDVFDDCKEDAAKEAAEEEIVRLNLSVEPSRARKGLPRKESIVSAKPRRLTTGASDDTLDGSIRRNKARSPLRSTLRSTREAATVKIRNQSVPPSNATRLLSDATKSRRSSSPIVAIATQGKKSPKQLRVVSASSGRQRHALASRSTSSLASEQAASRPEYRPRSGGAHERQLSLKQRPTGNSKTLRASPLRHGGLSGHRRRSSAAADALQPELVSDQRLGRKDVTRSSNHRRHASPAALESRYLSRGEGKSRSRRSSGNVKLPKL
eukprot:TRINITY_DN12185_c0_g1_i1.p1 TRINITY_DN12185_c0_g1~~TRINITY_DN12185_c0_g1_i1.p1  ORF type:complete len:650 (+),score=67.64 TRINITY_DN12185_c0_g1_i1:1039-2988(+)